MINNYNSVCSSLMTQLTSRFGSRTGASASSSSRSMGFSWLVMTLLLLSFVTGQRTWAQSLANYTYATGTTGSLEDLSSGATAIMTGRNDDTGGTVTAIGFNFVFMGQVYTHFSANSNGQMMLHTSASATAAASQQSSPSAGLAILAPMSGDNEVGNGIRIKVIGSAPNRKLVVEWNQFNVSFTDITNAGNMQVWIEETTGVVTYIYGELFNTSSSSATRSIFIASSNTATTAGSITVGTSPTFGLSATPVGNTIAAGSGTTTGSPLVANLGSAAQGSRRFFTWTPSTALPSAPTTLTYTAVTASTITPNWVDNSTNESFFIVTRATDAGFTTGVTTSYVSSTSIAGTGTTYTSAQTGLVPGTTYYFKIVAATEGNVSGTGITGSQATPNGTTYYWVGVAAGADFNTAANWNTNPAGGGSTRATALATDVLVIDGAGTTANAAAVITLAAPGSCGQLLITGTTAVTIQSTTTTQRLITINGGPGSDLDIPSGTTLNLTNTNPVGIAFSGTGNTGNIAGTYNAAGSTSNVITTTGGTGTLVTVTGSVNNNIPGSSGCMLGSAATLSFAAGSNYSHGSYTTTNAFIPLATWDTNSTVTITGGSSTGSTGTTNPAQSFGNFVYNTTTNTNTMSMWTSSTTAVIKGNLTVSAAGTGAGKLRLVTSGTLTVNGNVNITGGVTEISNNSSGLLIVNGNVNVSGGTFDVAFNNAPTLRVLGNVVQTGGTITNTSTVGGTIEFAGSSAQTLTLVPGSHGANLISVRLNNAAGLSVTAASSVKNVTVSNGSITGAGSLAYGASSILTYNSSTGAQTANAVEFPSTAGPAGLVVNNTSSSKVLNVPFSRSLGAGVLALTSGLIDNTGYVLTLTNTATSAVTGASATNYVKGAVELTLPFSLATGSTYLFPIGKATYNPYSLVNPTTNAGGAVVVRAEVTDANAGGTAGTFIAGLNTNRYWSSSIISGAANFTDSKVKLTDETTGVDAIATSATLAGTYSLAGGTASTITATDLTTGAAVTSLDGYYVLATKATPSISNLAITNATGIYCPSIARDVTVTVTPSGSAITSVVINYSVNSVAQTPITLTNTSGNDWAGTIPAIVAAGVQNVAWTLTATDADTLYKTVTGTSYVDQSATAATVAITSSNASFCGAGGTVTLSATSTDPTAGFSWTALNAGVTLSASTGASVTSTISATSDYSVVGTFTDGRCNTNAAVISIGVYPLPTATVTTTAQGVCPGTSATIDSGLTSGNFSSASITHAPKTAPVSATTLVNNGTINVTPDLSYDYVGDLDDSGWSNIPVGFNFNFFGTSYNKVSISTNGTIFMGTASAASIADFTFTSLPSVSEPFNMVAVLAMDNNLAGATGGAIKYWTEGIAPNRKFVVKYENVQEFGDTKFSTAQAIFYETSGNVEVHVTSSTNVDRNKLVGINNGDGTVGVLAYASGTAATVSPQNPIATSFAFRFAPPSNYTTVWTKTDANGSSQLASGTNVFTQSVAPLITTTYSISYTNQTTGCTNAPGSAQVLMAVLGTQAPVGVNTIASASTVCYNGSTNLSLDYTGLTDGITFQWQSSPDGTNWSDIASATATTYAATAITSATQYRCKMVSCGGTAEYSSVAAITFTNNIATTAGATRCGTGTVALTATGTVGASIDWYAAATGGTALATGAASFTTPAISANTTYYVEAAAPAGCSSPRMAVLATVNTPPTLTLSAAAVGICTGNSSNTVTISVGAGDYDTYSWSSNTGVSGTAAAGWVFNPTVSTTYVLSASQSAGLCSTTVSLPVTVSSTSILASASNSTICEGTSTTLTATTTVIAAGPNQLPTGYCAGGGDTGFFGDEQIFGVTFGSMSNLVQAETCTSNYTNYKGTVTPPTVTAGDVVPFSVVTDECDGVTYYSNGMSIFIDYNRDGDFDDAGELAYTTTSLTTSPSTRSGNITIPTTASAGATLMRVVVVEGTTSPTACGTYTYGETEDYKIKILGSVQGAGTLNYAWSDGTSTVGTSNVLTVSPVVNTTYTVVATDPATGCSDTKVLSIAVNPAPNAPTATGSTQCGTKVPDAFVADNNGYTTPVFNWYAAATGGTALQSSISTTYTSTVSATTTFYVAVVNPVTLCESVRTPVAIEVTTPDAITVTPSGSAVCLGSSFTVNSTSATNPNYIYTLTASPAVGSGVSGSSDGASQTITPTAVGSYTYTISASDGNCGTTANFTVGVNVLPTILASSNVSQICNGDSATLTASSVVVGPQALPTGYTTTNSTYYSDEQIFGVSFGTMNNLSEGEACSANYTDYSSTITAPIVFAGANVDFSVVTDECDGTTYYSSGMSVFIDYNRDGDFADAGEQAYTTTGTTASPNTRGGTITIPANASPGLTKMRIVVAEGVTSPTANGIGSFGYGETEDYAISIRTAGPTYNYVWNPGNIASATATVTPAVTTTYTVTATDQVTGCPATQNVTITQNGVIVAPITNGANSVCLGAGTVDFDSASIGVNWTSSNPAVGTIDANGVFTPVSVGTTTIGANIYNSTTGCTSFVANPQSVSVWAPLVVSAQPADSSILTNENTSFSFITTGSVAAAGYQWMVSADGVNFTNVSNGGVYSGATTATLTITAAQADLNGLYYQCTVAGYSPCTTLVTSNAAVLSVKEISITNPTSVTLCPTASNGTATFTVNVSSVTPGYPYTMVWEIFNGTEWLPIDSQTLTFGDVSFGGDVFSTTLVVNGLSTLNSGWKVRANAVNEADAQYVTSSPATITVNAPAIVTSSPAAQSVCYTGGNTSFTVAYTGGTAVQWQYSTDNATWNNVADNTPVGVTYASATTTTLGVTTTASTPANGTYYYKAVITSPNACDAVSSASAQMSINTPAVAINASTASICLGITSSVATLTASGASTYSWSPTTGISASTGAVVTANPTVTTTYTVTGTDASGCIKTATQTITVNPVVALSSSVSVATICPGASTTLTATTLVPTAGPQALPTSYAAMTNSSNFGDEQIYGVAFGSMDNLYEGDDCSANYTDYSASIAAPTVTAGDVVPFSVQTDECDGATYWSNGLSVYIDYNRDGDFADAGEQAYTTTTTTLSPNTRSGNITIPMNVTAGLTRMRVVVTESTASPLSSGIGAFGYGEVEDYAVNLVSLLPGAGTLSYSWSDGTSVVGTTNVLAVTPSATTTYTVTATNPATGCYSTSSQTVIVVSDASISAQPVASTTVCQGTAVTLSVTAAGPGITYQWYKDGVAVVSASATTATLALTGIPAESGTYYVIVTPICGLAATSENAVVLVNPTPTATAPSNTTLCSGFLTAPVALVGTPANVTFNISGGAAIGLANQTGVTSIPAFTPIEGSATITITPSANNCTGVAVTYTITVNQSPDVVTVTPATQTICANDAAILLTATTNNVLVDFTAQVGTGTLTAAYPINSNWGYTYSQSIYPAASLTAAGLVAGSTIKSISYNVITPVADGLSNSWVVYAGNTAQGAFATTSNWVSLANLTEVFNGTVSMASAGWKTITFTTPFVWTGGNLVIGVDENQAGFDNNTAAFEYTTGSANTTIRYISDSTNPNPASPPTGSRNTIRPNIKVGFESSVAPAVTWSPTTELYTNAGMTTAYTGGASTTVYARPTVNRTYTATATLGSCTQTNTAVITSIVPTTYYADADGDGYGNAAVTQLTCTQPTGYVLDNTDCNDSNAAMHTTYPFYADTDGDGYGSGSLVSVCAVDASTPPAGYSSNNTDCAPTDATMHASYAFYADADADGYGAGSTVSVCAVDASTPPAGYSLNNTDCNDANAAMHTTFPFYADADGDGYGAGSLVSVCAVDALTAPAGYSLDNTDCNDSNAAMHTTYPFYVDADGDGYGAGSLVAVCAVNATTAPAGYSTNNTDCNDAVAAVNPGHVEVLYNGIDDNCNGQLDEGFQLTSSLQSVSCGATVASMGSLIYTNINWSATAYRFKVVNNTTGEIQYVENNHQWFALNWMASYDYSTAYTVSVELQIAGVWLGYYGTSCVVYSPAVNAPGGSLQLSPSQCGATLPSIGTVIATTPLSGATGYRFRVTDVTPGATGSNLVQVKDRSYHWFTLPMLNRYNYGSTYMVEVAVKTTGGYSGYGSPCYVYTPAVPMLVNCGAVIPTAGSLVYTTAPNSVTQYRFQVTKVSDQTTVTFDTNKFWFSFRVNVPGYTPNTAYSVRIAVMTAGNWSPFGDACEITSPASATRSEAASALDFDVVAYPNPYADSFKLDVITSSEENVQYKVYDMLGKLIETQEVIATEVYAQELGKNYPSGVYNVIVTQGDQVKTLRVIKR